MSSKYDAELRLGMDILKNKIGYVVYKYPDKIKRYEAEATKLRETMLRKFAADNMEEKLHTGHTDMALPHPIKANTLADPDFQLTYFTSPQIFSLVRASAEAENGLSINEISKWLETVGSKVIDEMLNDPSMGGVNNGHLVTLLTPMFWRWQQGKLFTFYNSLLEELNHIDIGKGMPLEFFKSPFDSVYFELGEKAGSLPNTVWNNESGSHQMQGLYINTTYIGDLEGDDLKLEVLHLDRHKPATVFDIMFVGRAKAHALDDSTMHLTLYIQENDEMTVNEMIDNHIAFYSSSTIAKSMGETFTAYKDREPQQNEFIPLAGHKTNEVTDNLRLIAKLLVYLNCTDARMTEDNALTEMKKKFETLGQKKRIKFARRMEKAYDTIYIGTHRRADDQAFIYHDSEGQHGHKAPHWRRGHIRQQRYGEGNAKVRAKFIAPTLIGRDRLSGDKELPTKNYIIK